MTTQWQQGSTYSFNTYAPSKLGTNWQNVTVDSILSASGAQALGIDVQAVARQIAPSLPSGTPLDPTKYKYIRFTMQSGVNNILAVPWIDDSSVQLINAQNVQILVANVDPSIAIPQIRLALIQLGYSNLTFTVVDNSGTPET